MLKVGITGGIGCGKSTVCSVFGTLGIPVFKADIAARYLMEHDTVLVHAISSLLGADVYNGGKLDSTKVSALIYVKPELLQKVNELVHPATIAFGKKWMEQQRSPYILKEAAIFFESGSSKDMDIMIGVAAPLELRIQRAMMRSLQTREKVLQIVARQMDETEKMKLCDFVITNDNVAAVIPQVLQIHEQLMLKSKN